MPTKLLIKCCQNWLEEKVEISFKETLDMKDAFVKVRDLKKTTSLHCQQMHTFSLSRCQNKSFAKKMAKSFVVLSAHCQYVLSRQLLLEWILFEKNYVTFMFVAIFWVYVVSQCIMVASSNLLGVWTSFTWLLWFGFRLQPILLLSQLPKKNYLLEK